MKPRRAAPSPSTPALPLRGTTRVGISGWRYEPWRGVFYPEELPQPSELAYAARHFNSIEINGSFYSLQRPESYRRWFAATPDDFAFAVKGSRYITHLKRLRDVKKALSNFLASGVLCLEHKLGPILWQFPASLSCDIPRFDAFFSLLPRDTLQASALARGHSTWMSDRVAFGSEQAHPIRHAVEARAANCASPEFIALLRQHRIACVVADSAGKFPYVEDVTADFMYLRLHGNKRLYESGYGAAALERWAERIDAWRSGREPDDAQRVADPIDPASAAATPRDVYVYFDNDVKVRAPFDAAALAQLLGVENVELISDSRARLARRRPTDEPVRGRFP